MERVALPPEDYVPVCIHVAPHPDNAGKEKKGNAVPEGAVFQIISGDVQKNGKPVIKNVRTVSIKSVDTEKTENLSPGMTVNTSLWSRPKWRTAKRPTGLS